MAELQEVRNERGLHPGVWARLLLDSPDLRPRELHHLLTPVHAGFAPAEVRLAGRVPSGGGLFCGAYVLSA